jgi:hypothetical protein
VTGASAAVESPATRPLQLKSNTKFIFLCHSPTEYRKNKLYKLTNVALVNYSNKGLLDEKTGIVSILKNKFSFCVSNLLKKDLILLSP